MSQIKYVDTDGDKSRLLPFRYFGLDNYPSGNDVGRVYVGTGSENIAQAKKSEVDAAVATTNAHIDRVDNPHNVTKTQVGLSNVDNTSDSNKPISTATQTALNTTVKLTENQTIAGVKTFSSNIVGNITGNSGTATKLQTARTIGGVSFDGSANINLPGVNTAGNQSTSGNAASATTLTGLTATVAELNYVDGVTSSIQTQLAGKLSNTATAAAATKLATSRTINGVAFDGTANIVAPTNLGITAGTTAGPIVTSSSGTNATLPTASATASGVVTTGAQTWAGIKTFTSSPIVPSPTASNDAVNKKYVDDNIFKLSTDYYQGPYGIQWDYATDTYRRTGAKGYTAIQSLMRRCVLKADGTVNYYLNPDNSNFKEDGTPSVLTGADGNVMVETPKHYIKVETVDNIDSFSVSLTPETGYVLDPAFLKWSGTAMVEVPYRYFRAYEGFVSGGKLLSVSGVTPTRTQTIATFRTQAMANGAGWHLTDWNLLNTIKRLCYIEFCDFIVTKYLGNGNDAGADYGITTGQSNALGNRSSNSTHNDKYMSYRGIENMYADIWEFVDGVNVNDYQFYVNGKSSTFASDVFTGDYVSKGPLTVAAASNSLIKRCAVSSDGGFIPTVVGGSTTTFYGDALWSATGARIALYGGAANLGTSDGLGALDVINASSVSSASVGAAVCR